MYLKINKQPCHPCYPCHPYHPYQHTPCHIPGSLISNTDAEGDDDANLQFDQRQMRQRRQRQRESRQRRSRPSALGTKRPVSRCKPAAQQKPKPTPHSNPYSNRNLHSNPNPNPEPNPNPSPPTISFCPRRRLFSCRLYVFGDLLNKNRISLFIIRTCR